MTGPREAISQAHIRLGAKVQLEVVLRGNVFSIEPESADWLKRLLAVLDEAPGQEG